MFTPDPAREPRDGAIRLTNRARILEAAENEFARHGFKGTTVQQVADAAGLPKTNVLYYFGNKEGLYRAVLGQILSLWNSSFDQARAEDDPAQVLARYIHDKMEMSRTKPAASRIFALEVIHGAPNLGKVFADELVEWTSGRVRLIQHWIDSGRMLPVEPYFLLFHIWATCQHYADFAAQISALRQAPMTAQDFRRATADVIRLILTGCGLTVPAHYRL